MKRSTTTTTATTNDNDDTHNNKRSKISAPSPCGGYAGYSFQKDPVVVETVDAARIEPREFFDRFISNRKPCVLQTTESTRLTLTPQDLVDVAGQETVQVEKRFSADESFGQNRTKSRQIQMTIRDLVEKLLKSPEGELLYLSTQQPENDDDDDDDDIDNRKNIDTTGKAPAPFQTPCAHLLQAKKIERTLPWGSALLLESCNLWMGSSKSGSSSGLHHDYHDNFYLLLQGTKEFRLYSPDTAHSMCTYGKIERIHFNGVISYVGSETKADGTPVEKAIGAKDAEVTNVEKDDEDDESDEEEVVLGKGFDYQSDEDDKEEMVDMDGPDDFDALVEESSHHDDSHGDEEASVGHKDEQNEENVDQRPNSFSRIDPTNVDSKHYPDFPACNQYTVELQAGQILYLPAGWFHSVTSFSSNGGEELTNDTATTQSSSTNPVHMALNYWYHPPDHLDSFSNPYTGRGN